MRALGSVHADSALLRRLGGNANETFHEHTGAAAHDGFRDDPLTIRLFGFGAATALPLQRFPSSRDVSTGHASNQVGRLPAVPCS
jgi:hypothetical protein